MIKWRLTLVLIVATAGCRFRNDTSLGKSADPTAMALSESTPPTDEQAKQVIAEREESPPAGGLLGEGCLVKHLNDAKKINQTRRPYYSKISRGASEVISDKLILGETLSIPVAKVYDLRGEWYQRRGVNIVCQEFIDIKRVPAIKSKLTLPGKAPTTLKLTDPQDFKAKAKRAFAEKGIAGITSFAGLWIASYKKNAAYYCMTLHLLESIARAAHYAPIHEARSKALGIQSSMPLSESLITLQINQLDFAIDLDQRSIELHRIGIPIVCQDVPPIPLGD